MDDIFETAYASLVEHYENVVIIVSNDPHECNVEYNNAFAARGLLDSARKVIDNNLDDGKSDDYDIVWDDDEDDECGDFCQ